MNAKRITIHLDLDAGTCRAEIETEPATAWNPAGLPPRVTFAEALDEARHEVEFGPVACGVDGCSVCRGGLS